LTIFLTRDTRSILVHTPRAILWIAVLGNPDHSNIDRMVYGLFMAPLGWKWAGFVWAYALVGLSLTIA